MKFGIRIIREAYPQWKEHYLHYNDLKKLISLAAFAKAQLQDNYASAEKVNHKLRADIFKEKWKEFQSLIHHVDSRVGNIQISSGSSEDEKVVVRVRREDGNVGSQSKGLESISKDFPKQVSSRLLCRYFFFILNRELRSIVQFAKLQAENNTKALVSAIQEVIGDFNAKINEQFGENFKQLNVAVGDLVTWQDNYKEILDQSIEQFKISVKSIDRSKTMLEAIEDRYESNMKVNEDVKVVLTNLKEETKDLDNRLEQFSDMADSAKNAFPLIENNLNNLTSGFATKVDESIASVTSHIKNQNKEAVKVITNIEDATKNTIESLNKNTESAIKTMTNSVETSSDSIKTASIKMKESVEKSINEVTEKIESGFRESLTNVNQLQQQIATDMEKNIVQMDDALRQELEKSLQSLGSQLASLSQKFVDDYGDLTSRMRSVVTMAEG